MTGKERVNASLNHKQADKVAIDFGSTSVTGIHVQAVEKLRNYYGLDKGPIKVIEPYQMLGELDDELKSILGIDTIGVFPRNTMFGFPNEGWKEFKTFWGQEVLVPGKFITDFDNGGDLLIYPEGDKLAGASGRMPKSSFFFDSIIRQDTFDENNLDPIDNIEEFKPLSEDDLSYFENEINIACNSGAAVVANIGGTGLGDIALVPAPFLKNPRGIRDITEWYMSTVMRMEYIQTIFEMQTDVALLNLKKLYQRVGNKIDVIFLCGTDFGTQDSQFCAPESFLELYQPYYKKMTGWIHKNTNWKVFKHSCGAVEPLIENFIASGFDILNPVQITATGMDSEKLKSHYGDKLVFWGGGVDTQQILSFGTPKEVGNQVLEQCKILSRNGGFVFNTVHNIQANVPVENMVAMINALRKFNGH